MFEGFDKLPQFLQLCIGIGCALGVAYMVVTSLKMRKFFSAEKVEDDKDLETEIAEIKQEFSISRRKIYERIEDFDKAIDLRYDGLQERVRQLEIAFAEFRGRNAPRR